MNKILGFMAKHNASVAIGVCTGAYLIYLGITTVWDKKRHDKEMETQEMLQRQIRSTFAETTKSEES